MNQATIGFLRGLGYTIVFAICNFIVSNLGASGIVSGSVSTIIVAIVGSVEHYLNDPAAPTSAASATQ